MPELVHATAVAVAGQAVLLRGPSGAGKSDLALRLISARESFPGLSSPPILVADDCAHLTVVAGSVEVSAPSSIAGLLEVRGVGMLSVPFAARAKVALVVDLVLAQDVPRLPEAKSVLLLGIAVPWLALDAFAASSAIKVMGALAVACQTEPGERPSPKALASRGDPSQT